MLSVNSSTVCCEIEEKYVYFYMFRDTRGPTVLHFNETDNQTETINFTKLQDLENLAKIKNNRCHEAHHSHHSGFVCIIIIRSFVSY